MRGIVHKRIEDGRGRTVVAGVSLPFMVEGLLLRYPFGLVDALTPDGPDAFDGVALLVGIRVGTFRMTRRKRVPPTPPTSIGSAAERREGSRR